MIRRPPSSTRTATLCPYPTLCRSRAGGHRFLPNVYAFPGGRLDSSDRSETPLNNLKYNRNYIKSHLGCEPATATALAVAAVRETWEETGIPPGRFAAGRRQPDKTGRAAGRDRQCQPV